MIIVTGGAGLIGSAVVWKLDHLGNGEKWRNLAPLRFRDYIEKDLFLPLLEGSFFSIFSALDQPTNVSYVDMPEQIRARYQYYTCADTVRLRDAGTE